MVYIPTDCSACLFHIHVILVFIATKEFATQTIDTQGNHIPHAFSMHRQRLKKQTTNGTMKDIKNHFTKFREIT